MTGTTFRRLSAMAACSAACLDILEQFPRFFVGKFQKMPTTKVQECPVAEPARCNKHLQPARAARIRQSARRAHKDVLRWVQEPLDRQRTGGRFGKISYLVGVFRCLCMK